MEFLWNGILFGLALCILVGPILFALLQASIEQGMLAGFAVATGIWVSDVLFVAATYFGLSQLVQPDDREELKFVLAVTGGAILLFFGICTLLRRPAGLAVSASEAVRFSSWPSLWLKGFLINTINPFTIFFWLEVSGKLFTHKQLLPWNVHLFYGGLLATIIATDSAKVVLAKSIRHRINPAFLYLVRAIAGWTLIVCGLGLLVLSVGWFGEVDF